MRTTRMESSPLLYGIISLTFYTARLSVPVWHFWGGGKPWTGISPEHGPHDPSPSSVSKDGLWQSTPGPQCYLPITPLLSVYGTWVVGQFFPEGGFQPLAALLCSRTGSSSYTKASRTVAISPPNAPWDNHIF